MYCTRCEPDKDGFRPHTTSIGYDIKKDVVVKVCSKCNKEYRQSLNCVPLPISSKIIRTLEAYGIHEGTLC